MNKLSIDETISTGEKLDVGLVNILGEVLWHAVTLDPSIMAVSQAHQREIVNYATHYLPDFETTPIRFLEVAAYAHISGYLLAQQYNWDVTLSDISVHTLALGAQQAQLNGLFEQVLPEALTQKVLQEQGDVR